MFNYAAKAVKAEVVKCLEIIEEHRLRIRLGLGLSYG